MNFQHMVLRAKAKRYGVFIKTFDSNIIMQFCDRAAAIAQHQHVLMLFAHMFAQDECILAFQFDDHAQRTQEIKAMIYCINKKTVLSKGP